MSTLSAYFTIFSIFTSPEFNIKKYEADKDSQNRERHDKGDRHRPPHPPDLHEKNEHEGALRCGDEKRSPYLERAQVDPRNRDRERRKAQERGQDKGKPAV